MNKKNGSNGIINFFSSNWVTLIVSLLCAIVIWGFIMMSENPERTKTIREIPVTLDGEADLLTRHLVVVGDREKILPKVTVKVKVDLLHYADLKSKDITAVAALNQVSGKGEYTLSIRATSSTGNVVKVSPDSVKVNVDRLNTKRIPVEIDVVNELRKGLMPGEISTSSKQIQIEGASSIVSKIEKAVYVLDLAEITEAVNVSGSLTLMDSEGNTIEQNEIYGEVPSVGITMPVYYYKDIPFNIKDNLIGEINANYNIVETVCEPSSLKVLSENKEALDSIDSLDIHRISVADAKEDITVNVGYNLPDGTWIEGDVEKVHVTITIIEKQIQQTFEQIKITVLGEKKGLSYKYDVTSIDLTIKCGTSIANVLAQHRDKIKLYINVADFDKAGEYAAPISFEIEGYDNSDMIIDMSQKTVNITVKKK